MDRREGGEWYCRDTHTWEGVSGGTNLISKHEGKIHTAQVTWDNTTV